MTKTSSKQILRTKHILLIFYIFCCFTISKFAFSSNQWNRHFVFLFYNGETNILELGFIFMGFYNGTNNEHGYLQWRDFRYYTDGENYKTLAKCEVNDQVFSDLLWVEMTNKLAEAKIKFQGCIFPKNDTLREELTNQWVMVKKRFIGAHWCILSLLWYAPPEERIKKIRDTGKWTTNALSCPEYFVEIYDLSKTSSNSVLKTGIKLIGNKNIERTRNRSNWKLFC